MNRAIRNYALIGDCETAALVNRDGSIDWLCWPRFDSGACFASLLGSADHGQWRLSPQGAIRRATRRYRGETLVLETHFETEDGACKIIDFMPIRGSTSDLVRIAIGERGCLRIVSDLRLRFDYGRLIPWIKRLPGVGIEAVSGPHAVVLHSPVEAHVEDGRVRSSFDLHAGERRSFVLTYRESHRPPPAQVDAEEALQQTEAWWRDWSSHCPLNGPWREAVMRSLITIKALTYRPTGGIVAAPTTSLPERLGGTRNWDYRFCWLRDATLTLQALAQAGYRSEAAAWRDWLLRAAAGMPKQLQPIYGLAGEHRIEEQEIAWLPGFCGSAPVRIGNRAYRQRQLDVYGEVLDAMHQAGKHGLSPEQASWHLQSAFIEYLETCWEEPDRGIWEVRHGSEQFTHSKVMVWVALDRAIRTAGRLGYDAPLERWRALRDRIHETVCRRGFNSELGAFVQTLDGNEMDASLLFIPLVGFLSPRDPRMIGTVKAIENKLMRNGYVIRYDTERVRDGMEPGEGAFIACSLWYADNLALQDRHDEAQDMFERVLAIRNDVGLLPEEVEPHTGNHLGNFPQALSHLSLVNTAYNLVDVRSGPAEGRSRGGQRRAEF